MAEPQLPQKYVELDQNLQAGHLDAALDALDRLRGGTDPNDSILIELFEIQLAVVKKDIEPGLGLNRIVTVMRRLPNLPFAREVYQRVSKLAYATRSSSLSHSHPPPPGKPED